MEIFKILSIALITLFLALFLKEIKPEISIYISLAGGLIILIMTLSDLEIIIQEFKNTLEILRLDSDIFKILMKIVFIGYLTEFSASLCKDAQNSLLADKIIFAGKIIIFSISIPIFRSIIQIIMELL